LFCFETVLNQSRRVPERRRAPAQLRIRRQPALSSRLDVERIGLAGECWPIATLAGPVLILELVYFGLAVRMSEQEPPKKNSSKPSREDEVRQVVRDYIDDWRALAEKLRRKLNSRRSFPHQNERAHASVLVKFRQRMGSFQQIPTP
jgi:hypothetical protein